MDNMIILKHEIRITQNISVWCPECKIYSKAIGDSKAGKRLAKVFQCSRCKKIIYVVICECSEYVNFKDKSDYHPFKVIGKG